MLATIQKSGKDLAKVDLSTGEIIFLDGKFHDFYDKLKNEGFYTLGPAPEEVDGQIIECAYHVEVGPETIGAVLVYLQRLGYEVPEFPSLIAQLYKVSI